MITVGLPTWGNKDNIWMPLEGLIRQETSQDWELIVSECNSFEKPVWEQVKSYWPALYRAGCRRLLYQFNPVRKALGQKWKDMAIRSTGDVFLLQASDDYPYPSRIEGTAIKIDGAEWYDHTYDHFYDIRQKKMILFDKTLIDEWRTGGSKAVKTDILRNLPDNDKRKGVDHFIRYHVTGKTIADEKLYLDGITTNGVNTISSRSHQFRNPKPPWRHTRYTLDDLYIPDDIKERLKQTKPISLLERLRNQRVKVRFTEQYEKFPKGHVRSMTAAAYFNLINYLELTDRELPEYFEKELT